MPNVFRFKIDIIVLILNGFMMSLSNQVLMSSFGTPSNNISLLLTIKHSQSSDTFAGSHNCNHETPFYLTLL